jgi:hypothetical protein
MRYSNWTNSIKDSPGLLLCASALFLAAAAGRKHQTWSRTAVIGAAAITGLGIASRRTPFLVEAVSDAVLTGAFYASLPATGALARALGKDPLQRRSEPLESYWIPRRYTKQTRAQFEQSS